MTAPDPGVRPIGSTDTDPARLPKLFAWSSCLLVTAVLLHMLGHGQLASPPLAELGQWSKWSYGKEAPTIAGAVLRLVAEGLAWYLLVLTVLHLVARLTRSARVLSLARVLTAPGAQRLVAGIVGVTVISSALTIGSHPHPIEPCGCVLPPTEPISSVSDAAPGVQPGGSEAALGSAVSRIASQWVEDVSPGQPGTATEWVQDAPPPAPAAAPAPAPAPATWKVAPGDHFWSIATAVVGRSLGQPPDEAAVTGYWRDLIEGNRPNLTDPGNPDLIFTGQVLELPPVPASSSPVGP